MLAARRVESVAESLGVMNGILGQRFMVKICRMLSAPTCIVADLSGAATRDITILISWGRVVMAMSATQSWGVRFGTERTTPTCTVAGHFGVATTTPAFSRQDRYLNAVDLDARQVGSSPWFLFWHLFFYTGTRAHVFPPC